MPNIVADTTSFHNHITPVDIRESRLPMEWLELLLRDQTTGCNIIWATDDYQLYGRGYSFHAPIQASLITGANECIIRPRAAKSRTEQAARSKEKAEVFTPSWVCNVQNNLLDEAWFGRRDVFNTEIDKGWETNKSPIVFPDTIGRTWRDYVKEIRMEITCGEAPYLTTRYDSVTGEPIPPLDRVGILDRKFRVVLENNKDRSPAKWFKWMKIALQSIYAYEWQGDSLLLARENILATYIDFYHLRFPKRKKVPLHSYPETDKRFPGVLDIISWNIWQMDGLRCVIPNSCRDLQDTQQTFDFDAMDPPDTTPKKDRSCPACKSGLLQDIPRHTGIQCQIYDWDLAHDCKKKQKIKFNTLLI